MGSVRCTYTYATELMYNVHNYMKRCHELEKDSERKGREKEMEGGKEGEKDGREGGMEMLK